MVSGLPKVNKAAALKAARDRFHRSGKSVVAWARENGFTVNLVYEVLNGRRKCLRGQSHRIAVKLGIKNGELYNED